MSAIQLNKFSRVDYAKAFLIIFYLVGLIGFSMSITFPLFEKLVPLNILISAVLLFSFQKSVDAKTILVFVLIFAIGIFVEILGTNTGILFGEYKYGQSLGVKVFETPLLIGLNWLILCYCFYASFPKFRNKWYFVFLASLLMVGFDFVLEPVAMKIDMWNWAGGVVPLKNYLDWYLVSVVIFFLMWWIKPKIENGLASTLIIIQILFFVGLNILLK